MYVVALFDTDFVEGSTLQGVTAASSGTHTHAGAGSRRLAWRSLARPSAGQRSYWRGATEIPAGVSVTIYGDSIHFFRVFVFLGAPRLVCWWKALWLTDF